MRVSGNRTSAIPSMTGDIRPGRGPDILAGTVNLKKKPYFSGNTFA